MPEYDVWLERVRPLAVYLIAVGLLAAAGFGVRMGPAARDVLDAAYIVVSLAAPVAIALRGRGISGAVMWGTLAPVRAVLLGIAGGLAGAALAFALAAALHAAAVPWTLIKPPRPDERWIVAVLLVPNAVAAAVIFQGWLQTKLGAPLGVWAAAAATLAIFAVGDRSAVGVAYALAPIALRATNGSLVACACAYLTQGIAANL